MIQAKWIDQALFEPTFINGNWIVHSVFQHSFNLQDPRQDQLICVSKQAARVPKGDDFSCRRLCSVGDRLSCWYRSFGSATGDPFSASSSVFSKGSQIYNHLSSWHSPI